MYGLIVLGAVFVKGVPRDAGQGTSRQASGRRRWSGAEKRTGPVSVNWVASWLPATAAATPAKARSDPAAKRARCRTELARLVSSWAFEPV
jgi:hypothetical protein